MNFTFYHWCEDLTCESYTELHLWQSLTGVYEGCGTQTHIALFTFCTISTFYVVFTSLRSGRCYIFVGNTYRVICKSKLVLCWVIVRSGCNSRKNNQDKLVKPIEHIQHYQMDTLTFSSATESILLSLNHVFSHLAASPQLLGPVWTNRLWILALHQCLILAPHLYLYL